MDFWKLWIAGIIIAFVTRIALYLQKVNSAPIKKRNVYLLTFSEVLGIVFCASPLIAKFILLTFEDMLDFSLKGYVFIIATILLLVISYFALGLHLFRNRNCQICFILCFILSTFGWHYLLAPKEMHIDSTSQINATSSEEKEVIYLANVSYLDTLLDVSPQFSIDSITVNGSDLEQDTIGYFYKDGDNSCTFSVADAKNCTLSFSNSSSSYVKITHYQKQNIETNSETQKTQVNIVEEWDEYNFYLPLYLIKK